MNIKTKTSLNKKLTHYFFLNFDWSFNRLQYLSLQTQWLFMHLLPNRQSVSPLHLLLVLTISKSNLNNLKN
jgi:hypothetical protein